MFSHEITPDADEQVEVGMIKKNVSFEPSGMF